MVANKKPSTAALVAGSRTNSTQATPKVTKAKSPLTQAAGSSSPVNGAVSSNESGKSSSWFASTSKSKKGRKQKSQKPKSRSFVDKAVFFLLSIFVIYTVSTCPFDKTLEDPVCKSLSLYRSHVIEPYLLPPVYKALQHPAVQPYLEKASEIQQQILPYVVTADQLTRPYVRYAKVLTWDRALVPTYHNYVVPQYHANIYPQLQQLYAKVDPYVSPAQTMVEQTRSQVYTAYESTFPHLYQAYEFAKPYALDVYVQVKPFAIQGYEIARAKSAEGYELAKPHAIVAYGKALEYLKLALAELVQLRRQYVDKHVGDIWDKVVELSGSKSDGSVTTSAASFASSASQTVAETVASVSETVAETVASILSTVAEVTATPSVVKEVVVTPSSVEEAVPSAVEAEESILPTASSTHVVDESASTVSAQETASDSIVELDLQEFLANLGIVDHKEEEATTAVASPSAVSVEEEKSLQEEPSTAEKRAQIKARYDQWMQQLTELFDVEAINVRSLLNGIRASGAKAVFDQGPADSIIDPELGLSDEDKKTILHADGVRVSKVLDILNAEGSLLLSGLDAVLKKEEAEKTAESTLEELQKKEAKWMDVLQKIEDKFYGSVAGIQNKVNAWFTTVRDIEIRECLESSKRVKALAERAQADLGLDYTWLEDVTVSDWKSYHELMNVYTEFDTAVRQLQDGSHVDPVEDPVIPALDRLQGELGDVISGFTIHARKLHQKAVLEVFALPTVESETDESEINILPNFWGDSEAAEPEVSILPIEPSTQLGSEGEVDASTVIVGKDASQIEETLKNVPVEPPRHEEL